MSKQAAADTRKAALLHHARAQMMQHGFANANLKEILRLAGGSKATVAKYFGNKAGLFAAALAESAKETMGQLTLARDPEDNLTTALTNLIGGLLDFYLSPEALTTYRGVIASAGNSESMAETFYNNGQLVVVEEVATYLERWRGKGIRADVDLHAEAGRLTHLIRADLYEQALMGLITLPAEPEQVRRIASESAALFLNGIRDS